MNFDIGISSELTDLNYLEDVEGSVLFRIDGNVIDSVFNDNQSQDLLRTIQWSKSNVEKVSMEMKNNNLQKVTYELNDFYILFFVVNSVTVLTTFANQNANLSLLSIEAKRKSQNISQFL
jgi:predicted regulator of Ras-like GTPase activity (Roadblock/LC7/MglB family)